MAEVIYDKSKASSQSTVKLDDGRFVRAENVVAVAGEGGGGGGATSASQVSMTPLSLVNASNVQAGLQIVDNELAKLQDQASVLTTSVELSTEIGGTTSVLLDELTAMDIDGRPSYKEPGATVYAENGVVGIIDTVDATNQTAVVKTVQFASGGTSSDNGIKGDYCSTYGITDMPNGVIESVVGTNNLNIPAGIVLKAAGATTLTTLASATTHETTSTSDFTLFYAEGEFLECGEVYYSESEPADNGVQNYQAWFNPQFGKWKFRSVDTGNVWREAIATPLCDCLFTDGNIVRIDFVGYRVLNKQTFGGGASYTAGTGIKIENGQISVDNPVLTNSATKDTSVDILGSGGQYTYTQTVVVGINSYVDGNDSVAIGYNAVSDEKSTAVGKSANAATESVSIGLWSGSGVSNGQSIAIGAYAGVGNYANGVRGVAIGHRAKSDAVGAIQLGSSSTTQSATNSDAETFKVANANGNFEMMSANGTIPAARHATLPTNNGTYVLKATVVDGVITTEWVLDQ